MCVRVCLALSSSTVSPLSEHVITIPTYQQRDFLSFNIRASSSLAFDRVAAGSSWALFFFLDIYVNGLVARQVPDIPDETVRHEPKVLPPPFDNADNLPNTRLLHRDPNKLETITCLAYNVDRAFLQGEITVTLRASMPSSVPCSHHFHPG